MTPRDLRRVQLVLAMYDRGLGADVRQTLGLTKSDLARLAGLNRMSIARYEAGSRRPRTSEARRIADVVGPALAVADPTLA